MGEMADMALEEVFEEEFQRSLFRMGEMDLLDAYERGIVDELGREIGPHTGSEK